MKRKKAKKKSPDSSWVLLLVFIVVMIGVAYLISQARMTTPPMSEKEFQISNPFMLCETTVNTGEIAVTVVGDLVNVAGHSFHFVSANMTFLNYTTPYGTVVLNQGQADDNQTLGTTHHFSLTFVVPNTTRNSKLIGVHFELTSHVQEVPELFVLPIDNPNFNCTGQAKNESSPTLAIIAVQPRPTCPAKMTVSSETKP